MVQQSSRIGGDPSAIDAAGATVRYEIIPCGAGAATMANFMATLASALEDRRDHSRAEDWRGDALHRVIVPVPESADPETVLAKLRRRIHQPIPQGVDVIIQTSGSSSQHGRLVGLSMLALQASATATHAYLGDAGRWIIALPLYHVAGMQMLVRSIVGGMRPINALSDRGFDPQRLVRAIERGKRDTDNRRLYLSLVPTQLVKMLESGYGQALAIPDAVLIGGARLDEQLADKAAAAGIKVVTTYGMTETCGGCVYDGMPLPGTKIAVVNERIWITGTSLMEGYVDGLQGNPYERDFVWEGGRRWWRSADRGEMHGARLEVLGRLDDVINTGGIKIDAGPVARAVKAVPGVKDAAVVGLPDERWGQVLAVVIVPEADLDPRLLDFSEKANEEAAASEKLTAADSPTDSPEPNENPEAAATAAEAAEAAPAEAEQDENLALRIRLQVAAELGRIHAPRVVAVTNRIPLLGIGKVDREAATQIAREAVAAGKAWVR